MNLNLMQMCLHSYQDHQIQPSKIARKKDGSTVWYITSVLIMLCETFIFVVASNVIT